MKSRTAMIVLSLFPPALVDAATIHVPHDHASIQSAIDHAHDGDMVLVSPGRYRESLRLKPRITVRSIGDDAKGRIGLRRAEAAVIEGTGGKDDAPGVMMAEGATFDGFTVTNVGRYDQVVWQKHYDSHGEELGDDEGAAQAEGTAAAIGVRSVQCTVVNNIVHHNGDVGIAVVGSEDRPIQPLIAENVVFRNLGGGIGVADHADAIVRGNHCYENLRAGIGCRAAAPLIVGNICHDNIRAGIGCRERAAAIIRGNRCYANRRAGIGIRMSGTAPIVESNHCHDNAMAGIGCRDEAEPVIRNNVCERNAMAGIGSEGAWPLIIGNQCRDNELAGIGLQDAKALLQRNVCAGNHRVAVGVTGRSVAILIDNHLIGGRGAAPIVAVRDGSTARIHDNRLEGGGVAAVLVQGRATVIGNAFDGKGDGQGNAVWVWEGSTAVIHDNAFDGYGAAVHATKADVVVAKNVIRRFRGAAIIVRNAGEAVHVHGNRAISSDERAKIVEMDGPGGIVADNIITVPDDEPPPTP